MEEKIFRLDNSERLFYQNTNVEHLKDDSVSHADASHDD